MIKLLGEDHWWKETLMTAEVPAKDSDPLSGLSAAENNKQMILLCGILPITKFIKTNNLKNLSDEGSCLTFQSPNFTRARNFRQQTSGNIDKVSFFSRAKFIPT